MTFPKGDEPRKGDRVRVTFDAVFLIDDMGDRMVDVADGMGPTPIALPAWASVEVLERANSEPIGLVKRLPLGAVYAKREARDGEDPWVYLYGGSGPESQRRTVGDDVADTGEVIGVAPGTPAAEARDKANAVGTARPSVRVPNEPGVPSPVRQRVADNLTAGNKAAAVRELRLHTSVGMRDAVAYVEDMPEYQTYLTEHDGRIGGEPC